MELKWILESLLFTAQEPMSAKALRDILSTTADQVEEAKPWKKTAIEDIIAALDELAREHEAAARTYRVVCIADRWQVVTQPEYSPWIRVLVGVRNRPARLSAPALETLAVIAYRQPCTRTEVEQIRGVAVDGVMGTLLERGLVEAAGRAEVVGRPVLYATTPVFLEYFGLRSLEDLPASEELRRIPVEKPEALQTVDPGLTTAPTETVAQSSLEQVLPLTEAPAETPAPEPAPEAPESATPPQT